MIASVAVAGSVFVGSGTRGFSSLRRPLCPLKRGARGERAPRFALDDIYLREVANSILIGAINAFTLSLPRHCERVSRPYAL